MNVDLTSELTHISLCTGYGGVDLGLKRALQKIRTICYVEIEAFVILNLVKKIEAELLDVAPVFTDLKRFPWEQFAGRVDILSGGFPCQPFSAAGRRAGDEDPRHLWPYITDGIKRLGRPSLVLFENVEGIISSRLKGDGWADPEDTPVLQHVLRELERLGYEATAGVFSAREVGAPHQRKRVFIMGVRSDLGQSGRDIVSTMLQRGARGEPVEHTKVKRSEGPDGRISEQQGLCVSFRESGTAYPAPRGAEQFIWEPPRTTELDNTINPRLQGCLSQERGSNSSRWENEDGYYAATGPSSRAVQRETESEVGRDADGSARWVDYDQLCESLDNRTDELRMLGNGVVPGTAERAFRVLWNAL